MKKIILASLVAVTPVAAQLTGEYGRSMYTGAKYGGMSCMKSGFHAIPMVIGGLFALGLTVLVWLWVIKAYRSLKQTKRRNK